MPRSRLNEEEGVKFNLVQPNPVQPSPDAASCEPATVQIQFPTSEFVSKREIQYKDGLNEHKTVARSDAGCCRSLSTARGGRLTMPGSVNGVVLNDSASVLLCLAHVNNLNSLSSTQPASTVCITPTHKRHLSAYWLIYKCNHRFLAADSPVDNNYGQAGASRDCPSAQ